MRIFQINLKSSQKKFKFAINVFKHNVNHDHCSQGPNAHTIGDDGRYKKPIYTEQITKNE